MSDIRAPFTPEQVAALNQFQNVRWFHSFTCARRVDHPACSGVLIATTEGWHCPAASCGYTQDWAHGFMANPTFLERGERAYRRLLGGIELEDPADDGA
jgi:hypothetical protein